VLRRLIVPPGAAPGAERLVLARAIRGAVDGFASLVLVVYLADLGFSQLEIGALVTAMLFGSAALTLAVGLAGGRMRERVVLFAACALMLATGLGWGAFTAFAPLLAVAFVGTLNPSDADVSVFLPTEQSLLAGAVAGGERVALFARYNLAGALAGALGSLAAGLPELAADALGAPHSAAFRAAFVIYGLAALAIAWLYRGLPERGAAHGVVAAPLSRSRPVVLRLTALFALDSFGGGFAVKAMLALWLFQRFGLSTQSVGIVFFVASLLAGFSQLGSTWLAARIGLVRTMVYTHLPANAFLVLAAFMPNAPLAVTCLLLRMAFSQMDVPARQAYVMAIVPPDERAAAASVTNVPRSLATALSPSLAGALLAVSSFGWPLVIGGALKIAYDLLLLAQFRNAPPPEEVTSSRAA
jgi:predicted MFS family arabinose efflux permease